MSQLPLHEIIDASSLSYHLENTPLAIIVWDDNDRIIYWSKRASEIFEWTEAEVLQKHVYELNIIHKEDVLSVADKVEAIKSKKISSNHNINRNYTKSGRVITCEWY